MGKGKKILLLFLAAALFFSSGRLLPGINEQRERYNLTVDLPIEDAPPELVLMTTALGGFRGLLVNFLWIRAMELQQEGKYFELVQLFDWIGKLQPRFDSVWVYAGWNMAYNISVKLTTPGERWAWISRGIEIIRDEGLRYNPRNPGMYRELAWIYFHKIGMLMDEFHWEYKFYLADRMGRIAGPGNEFLRGMADVQNLSREDLLRDPDVSALCEKIAARGYQPFGEDFADIVLGYREAPEWFADIFKDAGPADPAARLVSYIRLRELSRQFRLEPRRMIKLMEEFGPMDWRLAQSIALYWLHMGAEIAEGEQGINHDRLILHCLTNLAQHGRLIITEAGMPVTEPDFRFIEPADRYYAYMVEKYEHDRGIASARESFLKTMVVNLFTYGRREQALSTYARLREFRPGSYRASMEDFVLNRIMERVGDVSVPEISALIHGTIRQALYELALGNDERAAGMENLAKMIWSKHMRIYERSPRMHLPPYEDLRDETVSRVLGGDFPEELLPYLRRRLREE